MLLDFDFLWFFRSNKRDALHTNYFCCCLPPKESISGRSLSSCLSRPDPVVAWYLDSNFPTVLQMTSKYGADFETAVLANANLWWWERRARLFSFCGTWLTGVDIHDIMTWYELDMMILCIPVAYSNIASQYTPISCLALSDVLFTKFLIITIQQSSRGQSCVVIFEIINSIEWRAKCMFDFGWWIIKRIRTPTCVCVQLHAFSHYQYAQDM